MDGTERRNLLKSSFDVNFSHNCSSWLSNHPEGSSRNSRITPLTWSENVYRVEIKNDAVDLICVRRKFHQISNHDQRKTKSDGGNEPKKVWQIFGEGVGMSHSRSFSKRPAVASPPIPAPLNQPLRQCEPPPQNRLCNTLCRAALPPKPRSLHSPISILLISPNQFVRSREMFGQAPILACHPLPHRRLARPFIRRCPRPRCRSELLAVQRRRGDPAPHQPVPLKSCGNQNARGIRMRAVLGVHLDQQPVMRRRLPLADAATPSSLPPLRRHGTCGAAGPSIRVRAF